MVKRELTFMVCIDDQMSTWRLEARIADAIPNPAPAPQDIYWLSEKGYSYVL